MDKTISALIKPAMAALCLSLGVQAPALANKADDTLVWASNLDVDTTDVYYQTAREVIITALNMCDSLIHRNPQTGAYEPLLAESYEWKDPLTFHVKLRKDVKFWNGNPLQAKDVAYTFNHARNPDNTSLLRFLVGWIKDIEVVNDHELLIHAKDPTPAAISYMADQLPIYPDGHYENARVISDVNGKVTRDYGAVLPVCTGPYVLKDFKPGSGFSLVKNPDYFKDSAKGQPSIGTLQFRTIPDADSQMAALLTGEVDWVWSVLPQNVEQLKAVPSVTIKAAPTTRMSILILDSAGRSGENPIQNLKVRQAMAHAIDRESLAKNLVGPGSMPLKSFCHPQQTGCSQDVTQYPYDPEKARQLLTEAGYPDGIDINLYAYRDKDYASAIANFLRKAGIRAKLNFMQLKALRPLLDKGEIQVANWTWASTGVMDTSASTSYWFQLKSTDYARDQALNDLLVKADHATDEKERDQLYHDALQRIAERVYGIPLFTYARVYGLNSELDYEPTADEMAHFYQAKWK